MLSDPLFPCLKPHFTMKENPACQMALPYKNAHGSGPDHWPLSHPFCIGFPVFCPLFTICQTQNITQRLIQIIACPDIMVDKILHKAFSCLCCCQKLYNLHRIVSGKTSPASSSSACDAPFVLWSALFPSLFCLQFFYPGNHHSALEISEEWWR